MQSAKDLFALGIIAPTLWPGASKGTRVFKGAPWVRLSFPSTKHFRTPPREASPEGAEIDSRVDSRCEREAQWGQIVLTGSGRLSETRRDALNYRRIHAVQGVDYTGFNPRYGDLL